MVYAHVPGSMPLLPLSLVHTGQGTKDELTAPQMPGRPTHAQPPALHRAAFIIFRATSVTHAFGANVTPLRPLPMQAPFAYAGALGSAQEQCVGRSLAPGYQHPGVSVLCAHASHVARTHTYTHTTGATHLGSSSCLLQGPAARQSAVSPAAEGGPPGCCGFSAWGLATHLLAGQDPARMRQARNIITS
eukprot:999226-Pelagomonas_calceolata.AAC.1